MARRGLCGNEADRRARHNDADIIYGINPVKEALRAGKRKIRSITLLKRKSNFFKDIIGVAQDRHIRIIYADERTIEKKTASSMHQGIVADVSTYEYEEFEKVLAYGQKSEHSLALILDSITDPMNFGSIIRSALLFNVDFIITEERNSSPVTATVCRASAGAVEHMKISKTVNLTRAAEELKEAGFWIYGSDSNTTLSMEKLNFPEKKAIVLGSEGKGIRRLLKNSCDDVFFIPTTGKIDSLNVSAAASAILSILYLQTKTE